jgi:hypothetical protein
MEVNQLAFDPSVYRTIHERLAKLGTKFLGRRQFDTQGYAMLSRSEWMALHESDHVDFAVLKRESLHGSLAAVSPAFGNERWVVIDLGRLGSVQKEDASGR